MNPRDVPEVVAELIMEMHEVRSHLQAIDGRLDRMDSRLESANRQLQDVNSGLQDVNNRLASVEGEIRQMREENRQNTDRLIDAFGRSMEPLINRILSHEQRLGRLENPAAE